MVSAKGIWRNVALSAGARFLVMPVSAVLGIVATRLILESFGPLAYVQYGLLVGIGSLLPFADLGLSAVVMNAVAQSPDVRRDGELQAVLLTALRLLLVSGGVIVLVSVVLTALGAWPDLLGQGLMPGSGSLVAGGCLALVGLALPLGVGERILTGLGKNHRTILVNGLQTPLVLGAIALSVLLGLPVGSVIATFPYTAILLLAAVLTLTAGRLVSPTLGRAAKLVLSRARGRKVGHVAWPMLVVMMATPLAMQTDRIVLSHVSTVPELAEYSLASQMFVPIWALTNAAGMALWPVFARNRAAGEDQSPASYAWVFAGIAAVAALAVSLASPLLAAAASGGRISISVPVLVAFSLLQIVQAAKYPFGIFLTDAAGLRFQVWMVLAMLPVNLGLSVLLAQEHGAVGPLIGSAVGVLIFQFLANWWYSSRVLERRRVPVPAEVEPGEGVVSGKDVRSAR